MQIEQAAEANENEQNRLNSMLALKNLELEQAKLDSERLGRLAQEQKNALDLLRAELGAKQRQHKLLLEKLALAERTLVAIDFKL